MQDNTNNIKKIVADAVRDAITPLFEQMQQLEKKYNSENISQQPQKLENEVPAFDVSVFRKGLEASGRIPKKE